MLVQEDIGRSIAAGSRFNSKRHVENLNSWEKEAIEYQEKVIGRSKPDNVEQADDARLPGRTPRRARLKSTGKEVKMSAKTGPGAMSANTVPCSLAKMPASVIETAHPDDNPGQRWQLRPPPRLCFRPNRLPLLHALQNLAAGTAIAKKHHHDYYSRIPRLPLRWNLPFRLRLLTHVAALFHDEQRNESFLTENGFPDLSARYLRKKTPHQ